MTTQQKIYINCHRGMVGSDIRIEPRYLFPNEIESLLGEPRKIAQKLGWVPEITKQENCAKTVTGDFTQAKKHSIFKTRGYQVTLSVECRG